MTDDPIRRVTFPADPVLMTTTPPGRPPPARFDADPDISAEKAVERGVATEAEAAWVEWLQEEPTAIANDEDDIEYTLGADVDPGEAVVHFDRPDAPKIANEKGGETTLETTQPDPRSEDR